jgi:hypothetical protein
VLILDVGLYGTLISDLYQKGHFTAVNSVFFFGSRNPYLPGFLNLHAMERERGQREVDPHVVVRYVDTIECLLKPFQLHTGKDGSVKMEMGDPISLICSVAFLWALGRYSCSVREQQRKKGTVWDCCIPNPSANSWYLPRPIPSWSKAKKFIEEWSVEKITPVQQFAELPLYNSRKSQ